MRFARLVTGSLALICAFSGSLVYADSQIGSASTNANDSLLGTTAWSTGSFPATNDMSSTMAVPVTSRYLAMTGFGFTLPSGALVTGIDVSISRRASTGVGGTVFDRSVKLVTDGHPVRGDDKGSLTLWPGASASAAYGSSTDRWGLSLTAADVNASNFGVAVSAFATPNSPRTVAMATINSAQITITYFVPCPATLDTSGCDTTFATASLSIDERKPGSEKLQIKLGKGSSLTETDMGDFGSAIGPAASMCVYNAAHSLVGEFIIDAAGTTCETKPCWTSIGAPYPDGKGFGFKDKTGAHSGVTQLKLTAGDAGKTKAQGKASGKTAHMPLGTAAALAGNASATVQIRNSTPLCLSASLGTITKDASGLFRAAK
jgi:hypothetical protein